MPTIKATFIGNEQTHPFKVGNTYELHIIKDENKGEIYIEDVDDKLKKKKYYYMGELVENWKNIKIISEL